MSDVFPKLCRECKFASIPDGDHMYRCSHPLVNAADAWALSATKRWAGTDCRSERGKVGWFAKCGIRGKAWEKRDE